MATKRFTNSTALILGSFGLIALLIAASVSCSGPTKTENTVNEATKTAEFAVDSAYYLQLGDSIAQVTGKTLAGNLKKALQAGGVQNAIEFCSVQAYPLTDSLSSKFDVAIKRTSHKTRNAANTASPIEQKQLEAYLASNEMKANLFVDETNNEVHYFKPIALNNEVCLKCHGSVGNTIADNDYLYIQSIYPADKAVDFNLNDFRGMWSLTFKIKNNGNI